MNHPFLQCPRHHDDLLCSLKRQLDPSSKKAMERSNAAKLNSLEDKLGSLEAGKLADLTVVAGNPLDDLDALETVQMVYKEGSRLV